MIEKLKGMAGQSSLYGQKGIGTSEFDAQGTHESKGYGFPTGILIRRGAIIDRIGFLYEGGELAYGGNGGSASTYTLEKEEYIVKVTGCFASFGGKPTLQHILFYTSKGRKLGSGENRNGKDFFEYTAEKGMAVYCLFGRLNSYVNCIGFHTMKSGSGKDMGMPGADKLPDMDKMGDKLSGLF